MGGQERPDGLRMVRKVEFQTETRPEAPGSPIRGGDKSKRLEMRKSGHREGFAPRADYTASWAELIERAAQHGIPTGYYYSGLAPCLAGLPGTESLTDVSELV